MEVSYELSCEEWIVGGGEHRRKTPFAVASTWAVNWWLGEHTTPAIGDWMKANLCGPPLQKETALGWGVDSKDVYTCMGTPFGF